MAPQQRSTPPRERTDPTALRSALWLPIFDGLADPAVVARLAAEAEEAGWHGVFVWDHLRWRAPVRQVADPWITLAAIAAATEHLRLGPMVTPLARRRPAKVARETATLDRLSSGRLTLGVGLGSDRFGSELSKTGEQLDDRLRGQMLDEALEILTAAWSGAPVHHRGRHYTVEGIQLLPRPVQQPGVPVWVAGFPATSDRCAGPPATTAASRPTSNTPISSPRSSPPSPSSAGTRRRRTTSPSVCHPAPTQRPTPRRAPPGGWSSSRGTRCRWTMYAAWSATARGSLNHA
jgi:alkanesulfonate monooxygenase SsuD/methylene tetrahydromethanopterin reductase-like flavin-dependent oxidoreductase (luciferase family)